MIRATVIGWPIAHSKSPLIHTYWIQKYGLNGTYDKTAVHHDDLPAFVDQAWDRGLAGFNATIPHKQALLKLIEPDDRARAIGAINTVYRTPKGWIGTNTDGLGWWRALNLSTIPKSALILGAGGAARALIHTLFLKGVKIHVANRTRAKAEAMGQRVLEWPGYEIDGRGFDLIVNTSACGMNGENPLTLTHLDPGTLVSDLVYTPLRTRFLASAEDRGGIAIDGLGMLLHQAAGGFEKWFGIHPEITEDLRQMVLEA